MRSMNERSAELYAALEKFNLDALQVMYAMGKDKYSCDCAKLITILGYGV